MSLSIHTLEDFRQNLRPGTRIAALDVGTKTIGIALSTPDLGTAMPLKTITRGKWTVDLAALDKAMTGFDIGGLVVGLPLNADGSVGPRAQGVKQVVFNLIKAEPKWLDGPIAFVDETMSTVGARQMLDSLPEQMNNRRAKSSGALDALAAQVILERALTLLQQL